MTDWDWVGTIDPHDAMPLHAQLERSIRVAIASHWLNPGDQLPTMPPWHVQENKWRAARYGLDAEIILDADSNERLVTDDLDELLNRLEPVAASLGCADELSDVAAIARTGASYQRQRRVAENHDGDLRAVVDSLIAELVL